VGRTASTMFTDVDGSVDPGSGRACAANEGRPDRRAKEDRSLRPSAGITSRAGCNTRASPADPPSDDRPSSARRRRAHDSSAYEALA
jgi:hypothetical protein